jgi:hypothetical protein
MVKVKGLLYFLPFEFFTLVHVNMFIHSSFYQQKVYLLEGLLAGELVERGSSFDRTSSRRDPSRFSPGQKFFFVCRVSSLVSPEPHSNWFGTVSTILFLPVAVSHP